MNLFKNLAISVDMKNNKSVIHQFSLDRTFLEVLVNPNNKWCLLAKEINWSRIEKRLDLVYSNTGRPSTNTRLMCSLLIIKQLENLSDARVIERWIENPYYQYFSGYEYFSHKQPCTPSSLTHFRNRIGEKGVLTIFQESVEVNGEDAKEKEIIADTTIQEKNITFPTDTKLHLKIINNCRSIANAEHVELRQSYTRTIHELANTARFGKGIKQKKKKKKAMKKIRNITKRLIRELFRKLSSDSKYLTDLELYQTVINKQEEGKNKIYSIHEPEVKCYSKGKLHKKYEYGSKVSIAITKTTNVIVSVVNFTKGIHDSKTIPATLAIHHQMTGIIPKKLFYDRGGRGAKRVGETEICIPDNGKAKTDYGRRKAKYDFRRRSAIEPIIGHLKQDYRMLRNYLKGIQGDAINSIMAAAAFNFKRRINIILFLYLFIFGIIITKNDKNYRKFA